MPTKQSPLQSFAQEILLRDPQEKSSCDTFIYSPANIEEEPLGNLYMVGEIITNQESSPYILNFLASIIKKEYYSTKPKKKRDALQNLESSLQKANRALISFCEREEVDWNENLRFLCAVFVKDTLHLTQTKGIESILLRGESITNIGANLASSQSTHPSKIFSAIVSGTLNLGDKLVFATEGLFHALDAKKLQKFLKDFTHTQLRLKIEKSLKHNKEAPPLGALILEITSKDLEPKPQEPFLSSWKRKKEWPLPALDYNRRNWSQLIASTLWGHFKKGGLFLIETSERNIPLLISKIQKVTKHAYAQLRKPKAKPLSPQKRNPPKKKRSKTRFTINVKKLLSGSLPPFPSLPSFSSRKLLFPKLLSPKKEIIVFAFFLILILSLGFFFSQLSSQKEFSGPSLDYEKILDLTQQKQREASLVLIYKDEKKARQLLLEAKSLMAQVSRSLENPRLKMTLNKHQERISELNKAIEEQTTIVDHILRLENPRVLVDLAELSPEFEPRNLVITSGGGFLLLFDKNSIYELNLQTLKGDLTSLDLSKEEVILAGSSLNKKGSALFYKNNSQILFYDALRNQYSQEELAPYYPDQSIGDLATYGDNIYLLETKSQQIIKYRLGEKWNASTWIDPDEIPKDMVSFAIDGAIYVLERNGTIKKYGGGSQKEAFQPLLVTPLKSPTRIITFPTWKNLYILDPPNKRVVVLNKKGELIQQYFSEKFGNLRGMGVLDDGKGIYLLNGRKVFVISGVK